MKPFFEKMSGGAALPPAPQTISILLSGLGAGVAIAVGLLLQGHFELALMIAPFGASCFLVFSLPDSPLAQPRNIVFGHLISTFSGLLVLHLVGDSALGAAIAVSLAVMGMLWTRTSHAPAGADPLVVFALQPGWDFLLTPVLLGAVLVSGIALIFNNLRRDIRYPKYW